MSRTSAGALASFVAAAIVLGGCFGGGGAGDPTGSGAVKPPLVFRDDWAEHALPDEHDHFDPVAHENLSTPNFEILGWDPLISEYLGQSAGGYLCGDAVDAGDRRRAAVHGINTDVAFELVDITNASKPEVLGEFIMTRGASRDVALTPDANYVAIAITDPDTGPTPALLAGGASAASNVADPVWPPLWRSPCNDGPVPVRGFGPENEIPYPPGVMLVNVADPKAPTLAGYYPMPVLGAHSVYAGQLDGRTILIASVTNLATAASYFWFLEVRETAAGTTMVLLSQYIERADTGGAPPVNGHNDGVLQVHPVTGMPMAVLANWHQGFTILDMTDPTMPTVAGRWDDNSAPNLCLDVNCQLVEDGTGNVHEAIPLNTTWGGRHYTFVGQEILDRPTGTPSGLVHIVDTTDPANPIEVATWTLPVDVQWGVAAVWSTHYVSYYGHTLFVAHYHAGVWAIDLSGLLDGDVSEADKYPPASGVFVPSKVSPKPPPDGSYDWTPTIMDAPTMPNGDIVVYDCTSGIYVVRFDASQPAPPKVWDWGG